MTRWLILLILTVALSHLMALLACEPGEQNGPPETDRKALVALYNATDGPNWSSNKTWLSESPIRIWVGVTTDSSERVIRIALDGNKFSGKIPRELGEFSNLAELILFSVGFTVDYLDPGENEKQEDARPYAQLVRVTTAEG